MRWILPALSLLGFLIAWASHSAGFVALGVILGLVCGIGAALAFIDQQIRASSRPEHMTQGELDAIKSTLKPAPAPPGNQLQPPEHG